MRKPKERLCLPLDQRTSSVNVNVLRGHRELVLLPVLKKPDTEMLSSALYADGCQTFEPRSFKLGTPGGTKRLLCSRWKPTRKSLSRVGVKIWVSWNNAFWTRKLTPFV